MCIVLACFSGHVKGFEVLKVKGMKIGKGRKLGKEGNGMEGNWERNEKGPISCACPVWVLFLLLFLLFLLLFLQPRLRVVAVVVVVCLSL